MIRQMGARLENLPELMTVAEAAPFFRCTPSTLYRWIAAEETPVAPVKVGPRLMFSRYQVTQWLEGSAG